MQDNMRKEYIRRFLLCALGLACFSVGNVFGVHAGSAGTNAWNTLALGISGTTSLSFGTITLLISVLVIVIDIIFKGRIGFGTLMNALLISWFSDLLLGIFDFLPYAQNQFIGAALTIIGQTIISFSTILYMWPGLGCGPRDTLMVIIGKRFPKAPIGFIKFCMELVVLLIGVLLGAPFGLGTVLIMALQATIFQFASRICHYDPRTFVHEDILDTIRRITGHES
jgi:uncharacterized membrane protein YczE